MIAREIICAQIADLVFKAHMRGAEGFGEFASQIKILRESLKIEIRENDNSDEVKEALRDAILRGADGFLINFLE